jgi:hypothetical protein
MKSFIALLLGFVVLFTSSCNDATGNLKIIYKLTYNGNPVVLGAFNTPMPYPSTDSFYLNELRFFMDNLTIGSTKITDMPKLVNFNPKFTSLNGAKEGYVVEYTGIKSGTTGSVLKFGIGVDAIQNSKMPQNFANSDLENTDMYWSSWNSYIFMKVEGMFSNRTGLLYHTGTDAMYREISLNKAISIEANTTSEVVINIDLKKFFVNSQGQVLRKSASHLPSDSVLTDITNNATQAFSVQ